MRKSTVAGLLALATALAPLEAATADLPGPAVYDVFIGGLRLGDMAVSTERDGPRYSARAELATRGLVGSVFRFTLAASAEGRVGTDGFEPDRFAWRSQSTRRGEHLGEIRYAGRRPVSVEATPPFDPKPWEIEPSAQEGAPDPLSAFITGAAPGPDVDPCAQSGEVFDGRRRYRVVLSPADPAKPVEPGLRRCAARYQRVAGYKPKFMARPDIAFEVWFEEADGGGFAFLRAMGETPLGVATIRRRR